MDVVRKVKNITSIHYNIHPISTLYIMFQINKTEIIGGRREKQKEVTRLELCYSVIHQQVFILFISFHMY